MKFNKFNFLFVVVAFLIVFLLEVFMFHGTPYWLNALIGFTLGWFFPMFEADKNV